MRDLVKLPQGEEQKLKRIGMIVVVAVLVVVAIAMTYRIIRAYNLTNWTDEHAVPTVSVIRPTSNSAAGKLVLPGSIEAWSQAPVYARTNGYLKAWYVDIGQPVKAGQLLAEIDTPDVAQQLAAAQANLSMSQAQLKQSESTARRWQALFAQNAVSKQDAEDKQSDLAVKRSMVKSAMADMNRLQTTQEFSRIVAPFDGTVTSRATDVGALIVSASTSAQPLFTVADTSRMRVYVRVPQSYTANIKQGMDATLTVPEYPGRPFSAKLISFSGSVSDTSGTMLVQLEADNADKLLKPGSYSQVTFMLPGSAQSVRIPSSALMFRPSGMTAATVDSSGKVRLKPISIAQDFGPEVEVATGLSASDVVIDSPPDALADGDTVNVLQSKDKPAAAK